MPAVKKSTPRPAPRRVRAHGGGAQDMLKFPEFMSKAAYTPLPVVPDDKRYVNTFHIKGDDAAVAKDVRDYVVSMFGTLMPMNDITKDLGVEPAGPDHQLNVTRPNGAGGRLEKPVALIAAEVGRSSFANRDKSEGVAFAQFVVARVCEILLTPNFDDQLEQIKFPRYDRSKAMDDATQRTPAIAAVNDVLGPDHLKVNGSNIVIDPSMAKFKLKPVDVPEPTESRAEPFFVVAGFILLTLKKMHDAAMAKYTTAENATPGSGNDAIKDAVTDAGKLRDTLEAALTQLSRP